MNNLIANFSQILEFARGYGLPEEKKRGIIREYLQSMFLAKLYHQSVARKLIFIGGTSLRMLRNLNRFSEDLDFDNLGLSEKQIVKLIETSVAAIRLENIKLEFKSNLKPGKTYFELRFPDLLYDLKITTNPREKLMIKVDYSRFWRGQQPEPVLLNRYGFLESVPTLPINQIIVQKLTAYVQRKQSQPRDIYDVVWLFSQGARIDKRFLAKNKLTNLVNKAQVKWRQEGVSRTMINKISPFLFDAGEARKLQLFGEVIKKL